MAKDLMSFTGTVNSQFAGGGAVSHDNRMDPILYEDMIQYIEVHSPFRDMCRIVTTDQFVMIVPRKWHAGIAVEIVEGSEIPKARDVYDTLSINLRQNGTGIKMTDEEQKLMGFDSNYFATEAKRATERLLKKENDDIATVLLAGAGYNVVASSNSTLKFDDVLTAKTEMLENPYGLNPDVILMSHRSYADLVRDPEFKEYDKSGKSNVVNTGDIGKEIDGLSIRIIPEVGDNVYLIDTSLQPLILVQMDGVHVESYRLPETREDVLDLTLYEKPAILRPDAITKITITRNDTRPQRTFPAGWDPYDGYPALPIDEKNPETTRTLSFTINDGTNPIQDATVAIGSTSATTDATGKCTLEGIADGEQTITISATGYTTKTQTETIAEDNVTFTISLTSA